MISVCVATYNGETFIQDQLISVLTQLSPDDEVIISDDSSTDTTLLKIQTLNDHRIKILPATTKLGIVKNFERAIRHASGDYIFLCDQDDIWLQNKVVRTMESLQDNILTVSDCKVVDENLVEIHPSFFAIRGSGSGIIKNLIKNSYLGCCMAFRKELLPRIFSIPGSAPMHDMWIGLIAEMAGKVSFIHEPLMLYRRHGKNASPTAEKSRFNLYQQIKYRLTLSSLIIIRCIRNIVQ